MSNRRHRQSIWRVGRVGTFLLFIAFQAGLAQGAAGGAPAWADSTPARIIELARRGFPDYIVVEVLRQRHKSFDVEKRRELADSVVALASRVRGAADLAVFAIGASGYADTALGGVPNFTAMDELLRIARNAVAVETRTSAIGEMAAQVSPHRALPYLNDVATSATDPAALSALGEISRMAYGIGRATPSDAGAAEAILRAMVDQRSVKQGSVRSELCWVARRRKWPVAKGECTGLM